MPLRRERRYRRTVSRRLVPLLDACVPLMAVGVAVGGAYVHDGHDVTAAGAVLGTLTGLALGGRRRFPFWTVAVTGALALALFVVDPAVAPYAMLTPAAALFSLALYASPRRQWAGGAGAAAVVLAAELVNHHAPGLLVTIPHVALLVLPVLGAESLRLRRSYRSVLAERRTLVERSREQDAQRIVQEERLRIARDLHDVVAHTLSTINVQAAVAGHLLDSRPEHARQALEVIEEASRDAIAEVRGILGVLRDPAGGQAPRVPVSGLDEVPELVELARAAGLRPRLQISGTRPDRLPDAVSRAAFRIVQESLTNAARHSEGGDVRVDLEFSRDCLAIAVENSAPSGGAGEEVAGGVGIVGMTERAEALGGSLSTAASGGRFLVAASLPYATGGTR
jgi:signal transduction histidine kinase